jgi:predicted RNA-binding Zn ribbon-like protein
MAFGLPTPLILVNCRLVESVGRDIATLERLGGDLALDFANTLGGLRDGPWDDEWLHGYGDLVAWARHGGLLDAREAARLRDRAAARPGDAAAAFARALDLREAVHRVMAALAGGGAPASGDLGALRDAHRAALGQAALAPRRRRLDWAYGGDGADLDRPLWPVAQAAIDLLRSDDRLGRLKQCANCRWLFLDASRNASRRWCSMAHCGIDAKVRATRARRRAARRAASRTR